MTLSIQKLGRSFVARVTGIDLRHAPQPELIAAIEAALGEYGVLHFPDQPLAEAEQGTFIRSFGPPTVVGATEAIGKNRNFIDVGNVDDDGKPILLGSTRADFLRGNLLWHTDGSFNQPPIRLTCLLARELPPVPPPTEFADMRAAWNTLSPQRQSELEGLRVVHSIVRSREQMGMTIDRLSTETINNKAPVEHPLVRTHPANGRKSLYLAAHASHIVGWPLDQGRALLQDLIAFATKPQFVYSHDWKVDDLVMWDDRWTMHRATPYDAPYARKMRQCSIGETEPV